MDEERFKIMQMLADGTITTDEADLLLEVLELLLGVGDRRLRGAALLGRFGRRGLERRDLLAALGVLRMQFAHAVGNAVQPGLHLRQTRQGALQ